MAAEPKGRSTRSQRLAPATIRRIMTPLKAMLAEAGELEVIAVDCARVRVVVPRQDDDLAPPKVLTRGEIDRVLGELPAERRILLLVLAWTGVRIGEALSLRWEDVRDGEDGPVLQVRRQVWKGEVLQRTKSPAGTRDVAVVPSLADALAVRRRAARYPADADPIFASSRGTHLDAHNVRRSLRRATRAAEVPWATPHTFHHSLATELLMNGYDINVVARILGHRSAAFTRATYVHVPPAPRFDGLDRVPADS